MQFAKGVEQLSNLENISWGRVSHLGKSPYGKVYDSMPVYLPLANAGKLRFEVVYALWNFFEALNVCSL